MSHKIIVTSLLLLLYTAIMSRYYYTKGLSEAGFDRETANMKLEQCNNIIRGIR